MSVDEMVAMMLNLGVGITPDKVCPPALMGLADRCGRPTGRLTDCPRASNGL